ncbi:hypothetical protein AAFF_G00099030 [Aldrovandia affinis]|uniref:Uncharacterized protein n=1 Tax=Aldrovandia affinis TaxID=143900 RepID=A0AAD7RXF6_9TELE|nr:hypothetical protein AAFF_G00099030 [Aldrovandia affinis]
MEKDDHEMKLNRKRGVRVGRKSSLLYTAAMRSPDALSCAGFDRVSARSFVRPRSRNIKVEQILRTLEKREDGRNMQRCDLLETRVLPDRPMPFNKTDPEEFI